MTFSGVDRRWSKKQAALMKSNRENFQRVGRHARELKGADATRSWQPRRNYAFRYSRRAWFGTHGIATVETRREKTDGEREREDREKKKEERGRGGERDGVEYRNAPSQPAKALAIAQASARLRATCVASRVRRLSILGRMCPFPDCHLAFA